MSAACIGVAQGEDVAKDKKKKGKKSAKRTSGKATKTLKALTENPVVADVVAAALVATASALKDSRRARALASEAGDELLKISKAGAKSGEALWEMALQIGRRSLEALTAGDEAPKRTKAKAKAKAKSKPTAKKAGKKKAPAPASGR